MSIRHTRATSNTPLLHHLGNLFFLPLTLYYRHHPPNYWLESQEEAEVFENIKNRDGRVVGFDASKITAVIAKAGKATGEFDDREAKNLTGKVLNLVHELPLVSLPEVEEIQGIVERVLLDSPFYQTAKAVYPVSRTTCPNQEYFDQGQCRSGG